MKSFKAMMAEVAQPESEEEKKFKDQHTYEVKPHPVAMPHQHTGDIQKPKAKRKADQEGDANYDLAYESFQKALDKKMFSEGEMADRDALAKAGEVSKAGKKAVTLKKAPWDKTEELSPKQKKIDHNKNGKIDGHDLAMIRAKKNEEAELDEAFKAGIVKFKDGKQTILKKEDADLLNKMMKDLSPGSRKSMDKVAMTDQAGFDEILGFAREAL